MSQSCCMNSFLVFSSLNSLSDPGPKLVCSIHCSFWLAWISSFWSSFYMSAEAFFVFNVVVLKKIKTLLSVNENMLKSFPFPLSAKERNWSTNSFTFTDFFWCQWTRHIINDLYEKQSDQHGNNPEHECTATCFLHLCHQTAPSWRRVLSSSSLWLLFVEDTSALEQHTYCLCASRYKDRVEKLWLMIFYIARLKIGVSVTILLLFPWNNTSGVVLIFFL